MPEPLLILQIIDLPAVVATGPGVTLTELKSPGLYARANCRPAGVPPVLVPERERFKATLEPAAPVPEARLRESV
jgi:hypothetical protein